MLSRWHVSRLDHLSFDGGDQTSGRDSALMLTGKLRTRHWDWSSEEIPEPKLGAEKSQQKLPKHHSWWAWACPLSTGSTNKHKKFLMPSGPFEDPRSTAHVLGAEGSKEREAGFPIHTILTGTKNLTSIYFRKLKQVSILLLLLKWFLSSRTMQ